MPTNVVTEVFDGTPSGSNLALPQQELDNTEARQIWDGFVDRPGEIRRRGPVTPASGVPMLPRMGSGYVSTLNPQGVAKFAALTGTTSSGFFTVLSDDGSTWVDLAWPFALPAGPPTNPYSIVDAKPALNGGLLIGVSSKYDAGGNAGIALWMGGNKANYSAASVTVARGSAALTAPSGFTANVCPGMFLFANTDEGYSSTLVGVVLTVNSDTSITLAAPSPYNITAKAATFQSIRGLTPKVTTGKITTDVTSTTVSGGATRFISQGLGTGTWQLYRQADGAFIGKVLSVQAETSLTLTANAAIATASDQYVAIRADADYSIVNTASTQKVGFLNAVYADRQFYANKGSSFDKTIVGWFSDTNDPEGLDVSAFDGNWFEVISSINANESLRAIEAAYSGLLFLKENETFILTGTSPSDFTVKKLEDDGTVSGGSVQPYGGGVIWAGREGIHFYDGIQTTNLTGDKLGEYYRNTLRSFDPSSYRMWSMIDHDHYHLFIENAQVTVGLIKGQVSHTPNKFSIVINLTTRAITFTQNVDNRGAVVLPASAGKRVQYLVNGRVSGDSSDHGIICDGEALFTQEGVDPVTCTGSSAPGPDYFWESKKFDGGDSLRLKRYKFFLMHGLVAGDDMMIDVVLGLNEIGETLVRTFPASVYTWATLSAVVPTWNALKTLFPTWSDVVQSVFVPRKFKFSKKSTHVSIRVYQKSSAVTRLAMGPFKVGYKPERDGRI